MTIASGSYHGLSYKKEGSWGVAETTLFKYLRHTGSTLNLTKDGFQSNEIRKDRMITDFRHGVIRSAGDIPFEFSYGEYDELLEGALFGTWNGDILKAGTDVHSFTMQREFSDITQYMITTGQMVNQLSLSVPSNAMVTGSFGMVGRSAEYTGTFTQDPATITASLTNSPFDSFTGVIEEGGSSIAIVTSLDFSLANGVDPAFAVMNRYAIQNIIGRSNLTGTMSCYFEDRAMLEKFVNETESSIMLELEDGTGKKYIFFLPRIKYTGGDTPVSGEGAITISMPFQALAASTVTAQIDRITIAGTWAGAGEDITVTGVATADVVYTVADAGNDATAWRLIAAKLANAINAEAGVTVVATTGDAVVYLTAATPGTGFTMTSTVSAGSGTAVRSAYQANDAGTETNIQITRVP